MMDKAKNTFLAESRELLDDMETALLNLEANPDRRELVDEMFRAAHTIKGTAGIFSFDDIEKFTHVLENIMDALRAKKLSATPDLIAVLLSAKDHLGLLVEEAVLGTHLEDEAKLQGDYLLEEMAAKLDGGGVSVTHKPDVQQAPPSTPTLDVPATWRIELRFKSEVFKSGLDPKSFLHYLAKLGEVQKVEMELDRLPSFEQLNPEECYITLLVELRSSTASTKDIEKVFEFVKDDCDIRLLPPVTHVWDYVSSMKDIPEEIKLVGEALRAKGILSIDQLAEVLRRDQDNSYEDIVLNTASKGGDQERGPDRRKITGSKQLKVDAIKLDSLINLVGELVIAGATTNLLAQSTGNGRLLESISSMSRLVEEIRDSALRLRMVQIGETFSRFQRVVRDLSKDLSKDIQLEIAGGETELDKTMIEKIGDPLMHLVRNALDHGIESEEQRRKVGKPSQGTLKLNAYHDSGSIVIQVSDDGKGLDRTKILERAISKGLVSAGQECSDQEIYKMIFEPGFSTAEKVTNLSGRGVGMDVVKKNIESLRGTVEIETQPGVGTTINIRLPLTLAIIDGFLVGVGDSSYVIPLDTVVECIELTDAEVGASIHNNYINLRGKVLPFLKLGELFGEPPREGARESIVVVQSGGMSAGLVVDALLGEFQTVIKPLGKIFQRLRGVSGSTILGSGEVAVILDVPGLVQQAVNHSTGAGMSREASLRGAGSSAMH